MKSETRKFDVQHTLLSQLGEEHLAHAVLRRDTKGDSIVAWGERILQWDLVGDTRMEEIFPSMEGLQYSNGGCAMDVDGDGNEEILVARGGKVMIYGADEIQPQKFSGMNTHVSYWTIE